MTGPSRQFDALLAAGGLILLPASTVVPPLLLVVVYVAVVLRLAVDREVLMQALRRATPVAPVLVVALASVCWSNEPLITALKAFALVGTTALGVLLGIRYRIREQLVILAAVVLAVALASIVLAVVRPESAVMTGWFAGTWTGVFFNRNPFGKIMALGTVAFALLTFGSRRRFLPLIGLVLTVTLVFASFSRTAMMSSAVCLLAMFYTAARHSRRHVGTTAIVVVVVTVTVATAIVVLPHAENITDVASLSERLWLWSVLQEKARVHPWLGYGFGAFWRGPEVGPSAGIHLESWEDPVHGHNGFVDLALELGVLGAVAFLVPFVAVAYRAARWGLADPASPVRLWPPSYLVFFTLCNMTDSSLVRENSLYWAMFVALVVTVSPSLAVKRAGSRVGGQDPDEGTIKTRKTSLRILHLTEGKRYAGIEAHLENLIPAQLGGGDRVFLATFFGGPLTERMRQGGFQPTLIERRWKYDPAVICRLRRLVDRRRIDVLHTHGYLADIVGALALWRRPDVARVATVHGLGEPLKGWPAWKMCLNLWADMLALRRADRVIAVTGAVRDHCISHGICRAKTVVLASSVVPIDSDPDVRNSVRSAWEVNEDELVVGFVARLEPVKRAHLLADLSRSLALRGVPHTFVVCGDGSERSRLESAIESVAAADRFRLLGHRADVDRLLSGMDILVNVSIHEGVPLSLLAAMSAGVVPVVLRVGGLEDAITDGADGVLVDEEDQEALAETIAALNDDRASLSKMSEIARATVRRHYSPPRLAENLAGTYRDALTGQ